VQNNNGGDLTACNPPMALGMLTSPVWISRRGKLE
jgi:hypothetical protein